MIKHAFGMLACLIPVSVLACGTGEKAVFSCLTDTSKQLQVCQGANAIFYRYGKSMQKPELTLSEKNDNFVWEHGEGVSSGVGDNLVFTNGHTEYLISHVADFDDPSNSTAHVTIKQPRKDLAFVECASGIRFTPANIKAQPREMTEGVPSL